MTCEPIHLIASYFKVINWTSSTYQHIISSTFLQYESIVLLLLSRFHLYKNSFKPIWPFLQPISIYKIYSLPVPVNSSSNHATQLLDTPEYVLKTEDNQLFHSTDPEHRNTYTFMHLQHCINSLRITNLSVGHLQLEGCREGHLRLSLLCRPYNTINIWDIAFSYFIVPDPNNCT